VTGNEICPRPLCLSHQLVPSGQSELGQRSAARYVVISEAVPQVVWPVAKRNLLADRDTSEAIRLVNAARLHRTKTALRRLLPRVMRRAP
jgi:hypothetical protein